MLAVVTGGGRCGSSLMMRILVASGYDPYYDKIREATLHRKFNTDDYLVNESFLEISVQEAMRPGFMRDVPDGRCLKISQRATPMLSVGHDYKVIVMVRDPSEIRRSFIESKIEPNFDEKYPNWPEGYYKLREENLAIMGIRPDIDYVVVDYAELVANPQNAFERIQGTGLAIDGKAEALIDESLYRIRAA